MKLAKYSPNTLLDSFFGSDMLFPTTFYREPVDPRVDVIEREKDFLVTVELPGVEKEDVKVSVENGHLHISGEKKSEKKEEGDTWWKSERRYGSFARTFRLGDEIDRNKINASYKDGILTVTVPKSKESLKKDIEIKIN